MDERETEIHGGSDRVFEREHGLGHGGEGSARCFALDHPETASAGGEEEVDLKALLVAEVVELWGFARVDLALENLGGDRTLKYGSVKGGSLQLGQGLKAKQMASEA